MKWNSSDDNDIVQGDPLCLDENKMPIVRRCESAKWNPESAPECNFTQTAFEPSDLCPLGYQSLIVRDQSLCFLLSSLGEWQNLCLLDGSASTFYDLNAEEKTAVINELNAQRADEVWMPARKFSNYEPIVWTVGGESYGEMIDFENLGIRLVNRSHAVERECFSAMVGANLTIGNIRNCSDKLRSLCVFRRNGRNLLSNACPKNYYTPSYQNNRFYCYSTLNIDFKLPQGDAPRDPVKTISEVIRSKCRGELFSIESAEKTAIFTSLAKHFDLNDNRHCLFSVPPNNSFIIDRKYWTFELVNRIQYVNWDYPIKSGSILTVNHKGKWNWVNYQFNCLICQRRIEYHIPELVLHFDKNKKALYLTIYDEEFLWRKNQRSAGCKCFTNADNDLIKTVSIEGKRWHGFPKADHLRRGNSSAKNLLREKSKVIYELKLYGDGPGYYWCEGFTVFKFEVVKSAKIVAFKRLKGEVFAAKIKTLCGRCEKLYSNQYIKGLAKDLRKHLKDSYDDTKASSEFNEISSKVEINIENVRVMRIDSLPPSTDLLEKQYATILYHLTVSLNKMHETKFRGKSIAMPNAEKVQQVMSILKQLLQQNISESYQFISINSTEYCIAEPESDDLTWYSAAIGETIPPKELCLLPNGLPVMRSCVGDFLNGGTWQNLSRQECYRRPDKVTRKLFDVYNDLSQTHEIHSVIANVSALLQDNRNNEEILAADLFYLGRIINKFFRLNSNDANSSNNSATAMGMINENDTEHIFSIYNSLMYLNENTTRRSAALNSTNILLDAFDNIINGIPMDITSAAKHCNNVIVNSDDGTIATQTSKLIVYVIDPFVKNVSGIALIKKSQLRAESHDFTDYDIKMLYAHQSPDDLFGEDDLEIATFVPTNLLQRLNETRISSANATNATAVDVEADLPPIKIVITVYYNDQLFQEFKNVTHAKSDGKIIGVSIPGYGENLPVLLPIFIRSRGDARQNASKACGYWNFGNDDAAWSQDGCEFGGASNRSFNPIVLCACSHLTHFSYLIVGTYVHSIDADEDDVYIAKSHQRALDMITLLGCSLSLLGVVGIAVTAMIFRSWREKPSSIVLLQLSAAIALQMVLLCFVNTEYSSMYLIMAERWQACVALGALLQYSILVAFSWMLITAYLQFMRYVKVFGALRSTRFFLKTALIGWTTPLIPVVAVVLIAPHSYVQSVEILDSDRSGICYPSGWSLYLGLILPIAIIIFANLIIFILVIYNILAGSTTSVRSTKQSLALAQLRLSVFLFFLLGLSWIFGFLASIKSGLVFSYLFCITATIQGFVLFVYFIILDPSTRKLWQTFFDNFPCCFEHI